MGVVKPQVCQYRIYAATFSADIGVRTQAEPEQRCYIGCAGARLFEDPPSGIDSLNLSMVSSYGARLSAQPPPTWLISDERQYQTDFCIDKLLIMVPKQGLCVMMCSCRSFRRTCMCRGCGSCQENHGDCSQQPPPAEVLRRSLSKS